MQQTNGCAPIDPRSIALELKFEATFRPGSLQSMTTPRRIDRESLRSEAVPRAHVIATCLL